MSLKTLINRLLGRDASPFTNQNPAYARYEIGDWTYGSPTVLSWKEGTTLRIGKFCAIAKGVKILLGGDHHLEWVTTYPFTELWRDPGFQLREHTSRSRGDVTLGNDVWIGTGATILSGVTIHNGAAVGAESVVTKDVPAYGIVAGNPARFIRFRFDENTIKALQAIAWWDWPRERIREAWPLLMSSNLNGFLSRYGEADGKTGGDHQAACAVTSSGSQRPG